MVSAQAVSSALDGLGPQEARYTAHACMPQQGNPPRSSPGAVPHAPAAWWPPTPWMCAGMMPPSSCTGHGRQGTSTPPPRSAATPGQRGVVKGSTGCSGQDVSVAAPAQKTTLRAGPGMGGCCMWHCPLPLCAETCPAVAAPTSAMFSPILLSRQFPHQMPAPVPQLAHVVFLSMVFCLQQQRGRGRGGCGPHMHPPALPQRLRQNTRRQASRWTQPRLQTQQLLVHTCKSGRLRRRCSLARALRCSTPCVWVGVASCVCTGPGAPGGPCHSARCMHKDTQAAACDHPTLAGRTLCRHTSHAVLWCKTPPQLVGQVWTQSSLFQVVGGEEGESPGRPYVMRALSWRLRISCSWHPRG